MMDSDSERECQVSVCGILVDIVSPNVEIHSNRPLVLTLDDGTAVVNCVMFGHQHHPHLANLELGQCCVARGVVATFRDQIQIRCELIKLVNDVNFETLWINKVLYEKKQLSLSRPIT